MSADGSPWLCLQCDQPVESGDQCPQCGAGSLLDGRYRVLSHLGTGGATKTYEVVDRDGAHYALKVLNMGLVADWKRHEGFKRQLSMLRGLRHPGVVEAFREFDVDIGTVPHLCLVQELVDGHNLAEALEGGLRFDEREAVAFLEKMLDVLDYLHKKSPPVLHRDIKPSNIMLRSDGSPVLIDFDTARGVAIDHSMADGTMVGTAGYAAPEQLAGRAVPASDVYGLGMSMVAVLTHKDPVDLPVERMRVQFEQFVSISDGLERVLRAMVEPDVDSRATDAAAVRKLLKRRNEVREDYPVASMSRGDVQVHTETGRGHRVSASDLGDSWSTDGRLIWPTEAKVSSYYNTGWNAATLTGPPRVFPSHGDKTGAWASKHPNGRKEWAEVWFENRAEIDQVWIFETYNPGAVTKVTATDAGGRDTVLWRTKARSWEKRAHVVQIDAGSRVIRKVRIELDTSVGGSWNEIDTVALLATEPQQHNVDWRATRRHRSQRVMVMVAAIVALVVVAFWWLGRSSDQDVPEAPVQAAQQANAPAPEVQNRVESDVLYLVPPAPVPEVTAWATEAMFVTSEYRKDGWSRLQALGPPEVYPRYGDEKEAWAPKGQSDGQEYIEVGFIEPVLTSEVVLVQTFHPGAVARVDDISDATSPTVLWIGISEEASTAQIMRIILREPRKISRMRVVLDTKRVPGWNEIDAIGLVAPPQ